LHLSNEKVSVIIPVYNSENFLKYSIDSVLHQTYQNLEVIAIDDGSTDNSLKILQKYSDRITIIHQENKGLADALNVGIKNMSGRWFKWFSPDDVIYPNAIEILVNKAKKLPENTIIYSNWELIDGAGKKIRNFFESNYNELNIFEYNIRLLDGQQINVNTTLIPASLFKKGCLIQNLEDPIAIDYDFFLRAGILYDTRFYLISKHLVQYRIHSLQSSHKNIVKTLSYLPKIRNNILSELEETVQVQYLQHLSAYKKNKPFSKKTLEFGLKLTKNILPNEITDKLLVFYVNYIRSNR
jgi:glycosyltransferase involved in cell wall biosynthesis